MSTLRAVRPLVSPRWALRRSRRFATNTAHARDVESGGRSGMSPGLVGGMAGGGVAFLLGYSWYHFSGAKTAIASISQTQKYANKVIDGVKQKTPEADQALQWLRETTQSYAGFIPGARGYVDKAFDDLDRIHQKHGPQVDETIRKAYGELQQVAKEKGASVEGISEACSVLERCIRDIGQLAGDAGEDIIAQHPHLRDQLGSSFQKLQSIGENFGDEARDQANKTRDEVRKIFSEGTTAEAIQKAKQMVEQKTNEMVQQNEKKWEKGLEQAKTYLEKSPKARQLLEDNKDKLKQGNLGHLWAQVRNAVDTGSTQQLEQFIRRNEEQIRSSKESGDGYSGAISDILSWVSGGVGGSTKSQSSSGVGDVMSSVQSLKEIAQKHGSEAEKLMEDTIGEIKEVLRRKSDEAQKIVSKAQDEVK